MPVDDDVVRLAAVGRLVRRRWRLLTVLAVAGAVLGFGTSLLVSPGYTATSTVLLQGAGEKQAVLTETQIATSLVVLDRTALGLGWGETGVDLKKSVSAAVADGNVIRISGVASSPQRAQELTDRATAEYVGFSAQLAADAANAVAAIAAERERTVQERIDDLTADVEELERSPQRQADSPEGARVRAQIDQVRNALVSATGELDELERGPQPTDDNALNLGIIVLERATPAGAASPSMVQLVAGGALLFALLGVSGLLAAARSDHRLLDTDRIAAALGAPVLAGVEVRSPPAAPVGDARRSRAHRLRDFLREESVRTPRQLTTSSSTEDIRYRRVLSRLRGSGEAHDGMLVLLPDDDPAAAQAVAALVAVAVTAGRTVGSITGSADLAELVRGASRTGGREDQTIPVNPPVPGAVPAGARREIHVVAVAAGAPEVPDVGSVVGTLLVTSVGTRTAWDLLGIARVAADTGYPVSGALVVRPGRAPDETTSEPDPPSGDPEVPADASMVAGTA